MRKPRDLGAIVRPLDWSWKARSYFQIFHLMIEWPWKSCSFSVILVTLALEMLWSLPALTLLAESISLLPSLLHTDQTLLADIVCWLTLMWLWVTNILILWVCQLLFSEYTRAQYPTRSWLRKRSRDCSWLAWKPILWNKPKKDANVLCRGEKASYGVGHRPPVLLIL